MPKFHCRCSHIIDLTPIPSGVTGTLFAELPEDELFEETVANLSAFVKAVRDGKRDEWLQGFYPCQSGAVINFSDEEILHDILWRNWDEKRLFVVECDSCGRLWVNRSDAEGYLSWYPEHQGTALLANRAESQAEEGSP